MDLLNEEQVTEKVSIRDPMAWNGKMLDILKKKAGSDKMEDHFYQTLINNKLSQIATNLRANFEFYDGGIIPINTYSFLLATSGASKGKTNSTLEELFFNGFKEQFLLMHDIRAKLNIQKLAEDRSITEGMTIEVAEGMISKRFQDLPNFIYTYNDSTEAGFKSLREKLTISGTGSPNIELDELGINMSKMDEFLSAVLESFDVGKLNQKLTKTESSRDSTKIPTTFLAFGTGSTLLDGSDNEKKFTGFLRQGMARRCSFCYTEKIAVTRDNEEFNPMDILLNAKNVSDTTDSIRINNMFAELATPKYLKSLTLVPDGIWAQVLVFGNERNKEAAGLSEFDDLIVLNLKHSYWVLSKLMCLYAFIDRSKFVEQIHFEKARDYVMESISNFKSLVRRKSNFERIATYICTSKRELTLFDLNDSLPFYKNGNKQQKQEMLELAQAFAATHNMVIRHMVKDGIDYFTGTMLEATDLNSLRLSASHHLTEGFIPLLGKWDELYQIPTQAINYSTHHFTDKYRTGANAIAGFNMVVLDIDDGTDIETAKAILEDKKYLITTTRSHQKDKKGVTADRFRIFLPMTVELKLSEKDFKSFMTNLMEEFPIKVDEACKDIARFYFGSAGAEHWYNEGDLFDPAEFIPDTESNKKRVKFNSDLGDIGSLEKWFLKRMSTGSRNDQLIKFALSLVDAGKEYEEIESRVLSINSKIEEPLSSREISSSILVTVRKKIYQGQ